MRVRMFASITMANKRFARTLSLNKNVFVSHRILSSFLTLLFSISAKPKVEKPGECVSVVTDVARTDRIPTDYDELAVCVHADHKIVSVRVYRGSQNEDDSKEPVEQQSTFGRLLVLFEEAPEWQEALSGNYTFD